MLSAKVKTVARLEAICAGLRRRRRRIVFTNGCFDLLHYGHVQYLEKARAQGDVLVVGVNSDASVRRLKGPRRPVNGQRSRCLVLAGLASVDYVTVFGQDTPRDLIARLKPDVLVKGGDWDTKAIVGADLVRQRGGRVCAIPFAGGFSTSKILEKITRCARR